MEVGNKITWVAVIMVAVVLQVFVPALFDIVVSLAIGGAAFMLGRAMGRAGE